VAPFEVALGVLEVVRAHHHARAHQRAVAAERPVGHRRDRGQIPGTHAPAGADHGAHHVGERLGDDGDLAEDALDRLCELIGDDGELRVVSGHGKHLRGARCGPR
jgi:hypothetical protein